TTVVCPPSRLNHPGPVGSSAVIRTIAFVAIPTGTRTASRALNRVRPKARLLTGRIFHPPGSGGSSGSAHRDGFGRPSAFQVDTDLGSSIICTCHGSLTDQSWAVI